MNRLPHGPRFPGKPCTVIAALIAVPFFVCSAAADDFSITVTVQSGKQKKRIQVTRRLPAVAPTKRRQIITLRPGAKAQISAEIVHVGKSQIYKDVLVHFFVVREEELGQSKVPKLDKAVVFEAALTMDFAPGEKASWDHLLQIDQAGNYLLRVETLGLRRVHGHDHYAAVDLHVE